MTKQTDADTDLRRKNQPSFKTTATPDQTPKWHSATPDPLQTLMTNLDQEIKDLVEIGSHGPLRPVKIKEISSVLDVLDAKISSTDHALRELIESVRMGIEEDISIDWEDFEEKASANTRLRDVFEGISDTVIKLIKNEIGWFLPPTDTNRLGYSFSKQFALLNYGVQPPFTQERIGRLLGGASQSTISRLSSPVNRLLEINSILYDELERSAPISIADPLEEAIRMYRNPSRGDRGGGGIALDRTITPVALIKDDLTESIFGVSFVCVSERDVMGDGAKHAEEVEKKIESALPSTHRDGVVPFGENDALDEILENTDYQVDQHIVCFILRRGRGKDTYVDKPVYIMSETLNEELNPIGYPGDYLMEIFEEEESKPEVMSLREILDNYNRSAEGRPSNHLDKKVEQPQE